MNCSPLDTIAAAATPPGSGGVAIVRISGSESLKILQSITSRGDSGWKPRYMYFCNIKDSDGRILDQVLAVFMPGPHSYTGEDVAEIHCHGGWVLAQLVVDLCISYGARLAVPGEFTYRAFMAGKLDLTEAEAVLDLIGAKSKNSVLLAAESLNGGLSNQLDKLRNSLLDLIAGYEAEIDYGDEIEVSDTSLIAVKCREFLEFTDDLLHKADEGRVLIDGINTVLAGPPNAGKSTLWNALIGEDRALVTPYPGTTRDQLEEQVSVGGVFLRLIDTAGLHETSDPVEKLGIAKTKASISEAELAIVVLDGSCEMPSDFEPVMSDIIKKMSEKHGKVLAVLNKTDCGVKLNPLEIKQKFAVDNVCQASVKFGQGVADIKKSLADICQTDIRSAGAVGLNQRQRQVLNEVREALLRLKSASDQGMPCDCLLLDLNECLRAVDELSGRDISEDVLDRVFSKFCLGK